jgi:hypothetical protein
MMNRVTNLLLILSLVLPVAGAAQNAPAPEVPFAMPVPAGWRTETLTFPLAFAPDLPYTGLEELRFAPGMFEADSPDFWTYAMVWWVPADAPTDQASLQIYLKRYLEGLAEAVAEARGFAVEGAEYGVQFMPLGSQHEADFVGTVVTFDAFVTHRNLTLYANVTRRTCPEDGHVAVLFEFSPHGYGRPERQGLVEIRRGFLCP